MKHLIALAFACILSCAAQAQIFLSTAPPPPVFPATPSLIARYEAGEPTNVSTTLNQTFAPSDIDTVGNKLALTGLGFLLKTGTRGPVLPVFFSTTGSLPTPLLANTQYWLSPVTGGYTIYPSVTDASTVPGGVVGENPVPAQNLSQLVNPVVLTAGGSGTHTVFTFPTFTVLKDLSGNSYDLDVALPANRHSYMAYTGNGVGTSISAPGTVERDNTNGATGNDYGKIMIMDNNKLSGRGKSNSAKVAWQVFAETLHSYQKHNVLKATVPDTGVNIGTDVFTVTAHGFTTADLLNVSLYSGTILPAPLATSTDYYVRVLTSSTFTLHPTATDATNNTNIIDITTTGTGQFSFAAVARVGSGNRAMDFCEWLDPINSGNTLSISADENGPVSVVSAVAPFTISGASNGNITGLSGYAELSPVVLWFPTRAFGPVRSDTGLPLTSGNYWISNAGSSRRLHTSLANAVASVGVATSSCTLCIKYTGVAGYGNYLINYNDNFTSIAFGAASPIFTTRVPTEVLAVFAFKIDWNPTGFANPTVELFINGTLVEGPVAVPTLPKGVLGSPATDAASAPWTLWNSIAFHVPHFADWRSMVMGVSSSDIADAEVQAVSNYYKQLYNIP